MARSLPSPTAAFQNPSATTTLRRFTSPFAHLRPPSTLRVPKNAVLSVKCRQSENGFEDSAASFVRAHREPNSYRSNSAPYTGGKVFTNFRIFKGKAVLDVEPRPPELSPQESGCFKVTREGSIYLQMAPAVAQRQYDWSKKQVFSLSVTEIGSLISLGPGESCEFIHDPHMRRSDEGKVKKVFKAGPLPDCSGHFFKLSVQNMLLNVDETIYIPVTKAEFTVLVTLFRFVLPYLLGWNLLTNSFGPDAGRPNITNANSRATVDYEWSR